VRDDRISANFLAYEYGALGSVFWMPNETVMEVLTRLEDLTKVCDAACDVCTGPPDPMLVLRDFSGLRNPYQTRYPGTNLRGFVDLAGRSADHQFGESIAEHMFLLYLAPLYIRAQTAAFIRPVLV